MPCKENFEKLPLNSEHVFQTEIHGIPYGNCLKCGLSYGVYEEKILERLEEILLMGTELPNV